MFCPKCGSIMLPKKEGASVVLVCRCGFKEKPKDKAKADEKVADKKLLSHEDEDEGFSLGVVEKDFETYPIIKADCPKCQNREAYFWEIQTRAADEPPTKFLKCTKCKHTWRDYK